MFQQSHPRVALLRARAALFAIMLALTACGGGGGGAPLAAGGGGTGPTPTQPATGSAITTQPRSVVPGQAVVFSVPADGVSTYQWQRGGKDIPGATSPSYTLASPQASDGGSSFTVRATNTAGATLSPAAVLRMSVPKGLALVAGSTGGPGNLDGIDGRLFMPAQLAMQPSGLLYLIDGLPTLRTVDLATGAITTLQRDPAFVAALAVDATGNRYDVSWISGFTANRPGTAIYRTPPGGQHTLFAGSPDEAGSLDASGTSARFGELQSLATDAAGNLYVNDGRKKVRKVSPGGQVVTLAGGGQGDKVDGVGSQAAFSAITKLAVDRAGKVSVLDGGVLRRIAADGTVTTPRLVAADGGAVNFGDATGLAVDGAGNAYLFMGRADRRIMKVAPDGTVTVLATLPATAPDYTVRVQTLAPPPASIQSIWYSDLVADDAGNLYIGDNDSQVIRRITPSGETTVFAGRAVASGNVDATGGAARFASAAATYLDDPRYQLATDAQGNIYVGELDRIRKVTRDGVVATLPLPPAQPGTFGTQYYPDSGAADGSVLVVSNGVLSRIDAAGVSHFIAGRAGVHSIVDGVGAKASFYSPTKLIGDGRGNIYFQEWDPNSSKAYLRKVAPDGTVTTLDGNMQEDPISYWCADKDGNIWGMGSRRGIVRINADGTRTVVRNGNLYDTPSATACDRNGNLYLALHEGTGASAVYSVRKITPSGDETVIAGAAGAIGARPGTPGSLAMVDAMTVADDGTVYVMSENALLRIQQ